MLAFEPAITSSFSVIRAQTQACGWAPHVSAERPMYRGTAAGRLRDSTGRAGTRGSGMEDPRAGGRNWRSWRPAGGADEISSFIDHENFGIEINRRQVFAYDPAGSRPPAQRWIDLHAATRAKFMQATAEIGIAQKVVRLRMLDRFANRADEQQSAPSGPPSSWQQAAKECGGFYERYQRPKAAARPEEPLQAVARPQHEDADRAGEIGRRRDRRRAHRRSRRSSPATVVLRCLGDRR